MKDKLLKKDKLFNSHEGIPEADREFYMSGALLTALGAVIAVVAI